MGLDALTIAILLQNLFVNLYSQAGSLRDRDASVRLDRDPLVQQFIPQWVGCALELAEFDSFESRGRLSQEVQLSFIRFPKPPQLFTSWRCADRSP